MDLSQQIINNCRLDQAAILMKAAYYIAKQPLEKFGDGQDQEAMLKIKENQINEFSQLVAVSNHYPYRHPRWSTPLPSNNPPLHFPFQFCEFPGFGFFGSEMENSQYSQANHQDLTWGST